MSVSIHWEIKKNENHPSFQRGTSSDLETFKKVFGSECSTKDIAILRAMHAASHVTESLWEEIADKLESLQGADYSREVTLVVWGEW